MQVLWLQSSQLDNQRLQVLLELWLEDEIVLENESNHLWPQLLFVVPLFDGKHDQKVTFERFLGVLLVS